MSYSHRIADLQLAERLEAFGAVLIEGPKWCGKTTTAEQMSKSVIKMQDTEMQEEYAATAASKPSLLLMGETPRLIDEWQDAPVLWDAVRTMVDRRQVPGQFILTGSTVVDRSKIHHSGTGRISRMKMLPMSLWESGESNGKISLKELFDDTGKKAFINKWKKLETDAEKVNESIQSLFYYNMFYMRAKEKDDKSTTPGVRKYYLDKNKNRLTPEVIDDLAVNLQLWKVINGREAVDGEEWSQNMDIRKILDCLSSYTNEFWKYPVSIFFMEHKDKANFEEIFLKVLRKLYVMLLTRYLEVPTINAVKVDILKLNVQIINNSHPEFYAGFEEKKLEDEYAVNAEKARTDKLIIAPHKNMVRMLLKVLAYQEDTQTDLLPGYWEIEHIFPQTWDSKYYTLNEEEANEKLEHLGNKLPLEKKLNISASNNYFAKKKDRYKDSKIAIIKKLGDSTLDEWNLTNIDTNDTKVCEIIKGLLKAWVDEYEGKEDSPKTPEATPEELAMIKMLKEKGLI